MLVPGFDMFRLFILRILKKKIHLALMKIMFIIYFFRIFKNNGIVQLIILFMSISSILIYYLFDTI